MNKFLQQTLASFFGSIAGLFVFFALSASGLLIFFITLLLSDTTPELKEQSVLVFNLGTQIKDAQSEPTLQNILAEDKTENLSLRQITLALEKAAEDKRIVALFLDGSKGNINTGYASLTEIRSALEKFKASGKKIIAYNVNYGEKDYFLSSIADRIIINPMGLIEINGFSASQLFFAESFQKYGIGVQVIRAGKFKAAVEPFIRNNYSLESRQQTQELLTDLWNFYLTNIANSRQLTASKIKTIANNQAILNPQEARNLGLIDEEAYFDEVITNLKNITQTKKEDSLQQISVKNYLDVISKNKISDNKIAILYAEGTIVDGNGNIDDIGSEYFAKQIRKIRENEQIKAVILRINSPGGSAIASDIIWRELQLTKQKKPLIISMGNVAASGGYWIATAGEKIFAEKSTITGSIGVFGILFNLQQIAKNNGINSDVVKTSNFADFSEGLRPKTEAELQIYQRNVDQIYTLFLTKVSQSRNLTTEKVDKIAQGRVWSGEEAKKIGLVDEIGGLESAIKYTVNKLNLGEDWQLEEYPEQRTWEGEILDKLADSKLSGSINDSQKIAIALSKLKSELDIEEIIKNPQQVYAVLPFKLEIK